MSVATFLLLQLLFRSLINIILFAYLISYLVNTLIDIYKDGAIIDPVQKKSFIDLVFLALINKFIRLIIQANAAVPFCDFFCGKDASLNGSCTKVDFSTFRKIITSFLNNFFVVVLCLLINNRNNTNSGRFIFYFFLITPMSSKTIKYF